MAKQQKTEKQQDTSGYSAAIESDMPGAVERLCEAAEHVTAAADHLARAHTHTTWAVSERTQEDARYYHQIAERERGKAIAAVVNARTLVESLRA